VDLYITNLYVPPLLLALLTTTSTLSITGC
jgi:hypothetical protein